MSTYYTGSWRVETRDDGTVKDLDSVDLQFKDMSDECKAEMIRIINADIAAGDAPPDIATWGLEYENHSPLGSPAWVWLSYLGYIHGFLDEGFPDEKRREDLRRLQDFISDLVASGGALQRVRGWGGWRPPVGSVLQDRAGIRYQVEEHRENRDPDLGPSLGVRVLGRQNTITAIYARDFHRYTVVDEPA